MTPFDMMSLARVVAGVLAVSGAVSILAALDARRTCRRSIATSRTC